MNIYWEVLKILEKETEIAPDVRTKLLPKISSLIRKQEENVLSDFLKLAKSGLQVVDRVEQRLFELELESLFEQPEFVCCLFNAKPLCVVKISKINQDKFLSIVNLRANYQAFTFSENEETNVVFINKQSLYQKIFEHEELKNQFQSFQEAYVWLLQNLDASRPRSENFHFIFGLLCGFPLHDVISWINNEESLNEGKSSKEIDKFLPPFKCYNQNSLELEELRKRCQKAHQDLQTKKRSYINDYTRLLYSLI